MKIAITADEHAHIFHDFDTVSSEGHSNRLLLFYKSLDFVRQYCVANSIASVVHLGDMFESRKQISIPVLYFVSKAMDEYKLSNIKQYWLKGNHDSWDREGTVTSISILSGYGKVVIDPTVVLIDGVKCNFLPWTEFTDFRTQLKNSEPSDLVFTHRMFAGAELDNSTIMSKGDLCDHLDHSKYKFIFSGDVHLHQKIGKDAYYVGSLLAHSFKDKPVDRGFLVYDSETNTFEFVKNPFSPVFKKVVIKNAEDVKVLEESIKSDSENVFYDIKLSFKDKAELQSMKDHKIPNARFSLVPDVKTSVRIEDATSLTPEKLLETYCGMSKIDKTTKDVGLKILEQVMSITA